MFVCLAAGSGNRMKPQTGYLHKSMIPFYGFPFLAYSIASIPAGSTIVIVVNYLSSQIMGYFGNFYKGRTIEYFIQSSPAGTGDALFQFAASYHPTTPVIVWQADQMVFPNEVDILFRCNANSALCSETQHGLLDMRFWNIKPETLSKLRGCFDGTEYRALPALERDGLNQIKIQREKLELSFDSWERIELQCKLFKQRFPTEFR
jgi:choline kinase